VVDDRGPLVQALDREPRRPVARVAALALQRGQKARRFAAHIRARTAMRDDNDLAVERFFHSLAFRSGTGGDKGGDQQREQKFHHTDIAQPCVRLMTVVPARHQPTSTPFQNAIRSVMLLAADFGSG